MRPFYFLVKVVLVITHKLFYRRVKVMNKPKGLFNRTIYASNHANSFMDPLILGNYNRAIVHFLVRSDVFKPLLKPIFWMAHMLPIFRQQDGKDTKLANTRSFNRVNLSLKLGRNILIFAEGFTDDTPIFGLKPIKKGGVRMGFQAAEYVNWEKKIYLGSIGINYQDRNRIGSDILIDNGPNICLNDFREAYEENPNKTITDVTKLLEKNMQKSLIYVANPKLYSLLEGILSFEQKGFRSLIDPKSESIEAQYLYSKKVANWINEQENVEELESLSKEIAGMFKLQERMKLEDKYVHMKQHGLSFDTKKEKLKILLLFPLAILGWIHGFVPYLLSKKITEKIMKRKVFWGSVKMFIGIILGPIFNIPFIWALNTYVFPHWIFGILYLYVVIPVVWRISYEVQIQWKAMQSKNYIAKADISKFVEKRKALSEKVLGMVKL